MQFNHLTLSHVEMFEFGLRVKEDLFFKWDPPNKDSGKKLILQISVFAVS